MQIENKNKRPEQKSAVEQITQQPPLHTYPKRKKVRFEDRYTRTTIYMENEKLDLVHEICGDEKGEKTRIFNEAITDWLKKEGYL